MKTKAKIPVTAAERMRRFRTRRRNGLCSVRVLLHLTEIDALVDRGFLKPGALEVIRRNVTLYEGAKDHQNRAIPIGFP